MKYCFGTILLLAATGWLSCGDDTGQGEAKQGEERPVDSQMVAEHVDPSTKFPQEVIATDTPQTDARFVDNAAQSARETLLLAELAQQKATRSEVKNIAQDMVRDYRQLQTGLQKLQRQEKDRNKKPDSTQAFSDGSRDELAQLTGLSFDRQWIEKMVTRNSAVISRYEAEAAAAKNKDLKKLVATFLPTLKGHQQQLETCRVKLQ